MSASLASAMMNSRQPGLAWIAASLRSRDFSMMSAPSLSGDGDARTRGTAVAAAGPHRHPHGLDEVPLVATFAGGAEEAPGLALAAALGLLL